MQRALEGALSELRTPTTSDDVANFARMFLQESHDRRRTFISQALERAAARAAGQPSGSFEADPLARASMPNSTPIHRPEGTRSGYQEPTPAPVSPTLKVTQVATGAAVTGPRAGPVFVSTAVVVREPEVVETGPTFPAALATGQPSHYPPPPPAFDAPPSRPIPMPVEPIPTYDDLQGGPAPSAAVAAAPSGRGRTVLVVLVVLAVVQAIVILVLYGREWFGK